MNANLWFFLSICVVFGVGLSMLTVYLNHQKAIKKMELDAQKGKSDS